jgi:hypothetical protein
MLAIEHVGELVTVFYAVLAAVFVNEPAHVLVLEVAY